MISHAFEMRGDMHGLLGGFDHGTLDVCGDAVGFTKGDVIGEEEVDIDIMNFASIAMTQRMEGDAT